VVGNRYAHIRGVYSPLILSKYHRIIASKQLQTVNGVNVNINCRVVFKNSFTTLQSFTNQS
jgi:hypothetical protein